MRNRVQNRGKMWQQNSLKSGGRTDFTGSELHVITAIKANCAIPFFKKTRLP